MKIKSTFSIFLNPQNKNINFRQVILSPFKKTTIHNHHDREYWSILSGEGVLSSGTKQQTIRTGDNIEFMPFEPHTVENRGVEELRLTSYWYADWEAVAGEGAYPVQIDSHLMIETAFPTPNGPLHLGHLSGAYLLADLLKRCRELTGANSLSYCGTYGHTNHIDRTAELKNTTYADLVTYSENKITEDLKSFQIEHDIFLPHTPLVENFKTIRNKFVDLLLKSEHLVKRVVEHPYSELTQQFISESYVTGGCPHCGSMTIGMECESCGLYQDECNLIEPFHSTTKEKLSLRSVERLYIIIDKNIIEELAVQIYSHNTASSRVCYDRLVQYMDKGTLKDIPVSSLRNRGVPITEDQVLTVVVERALRSFFGLSQYPSVTQHLFFCGTDNLCGSGILMPYLLKVLGTPNAHLPIAVISSFCLLEQKKFSTSTGHAIWAKDFLQEYPTDLVRLYLCHINSPATESNFSLKSFSYFSKKILNSLIEVFVNGNSLIKFSTNSRVEAGPWLKQDIVFYRGLNESMDYCIEDYANHSPNGAIGRIIYLVEVIRHYITQSHVHRNHQNTLRTKVALIIHAYQCLSYCLYPAAPELAINIFNFLNTPSTRPHSDRRALRIIELEHIDIKSIVDLLTRMKQKTSLK